jgi:hypothetical protein
MYRLGPISAKLPDLMLGTKFRVCDDVFNSCIEQTTDNYAAVNRETLH